MRLNPSLTIILVTMMASSGTFILTWNMILGGILIIVSAILLKKDQNFF